MCSLRQTIQDKNTRLLDQVKIMQKYKSYITGEISNMVANHARAEEEIINRNTMSS